MPPTPRVVSGIRASGERVQYLEQRLVLGLDDSSASLSPTLMNALLGALFQARPELRGSRLVNPGETIGSPVLSIPQGVDPLDHEVRRGSADAASLPSGLAYLQPDFMHRMMTLSACLPPQITSLAQITWDLKAIRAELAWCHVEGADVFQRRRVLVGVADSGIAIKKRRWWRCYWPVLEHDLLSDWPRIDRGFDFRRTSTPKRPAWDVHGHGTHVAGVIGADADGPREIVGVNRWARLLPMRVFRDRTPEGSASSSLIKKAFTWFADRVTQRGLRGVLNYSGGGPEDDETREGVEALGEADVVLCACAGNDKTVGLQSPASLASAPHMDAVTASTKYDHVIAVGGIQWPDAAGVFQHYALSNEGPELTLVAPAFSIYSTVLGNNETQYEGTSFATPFASGVASLARSLYPALSAPETVERLRSTCSSLGAAGPTAHNTKLGYGLLDAYAALAP